MQLACILHLRRQQRVSCPLQPNNEKRAIFTDGKGTANAVAKFALA